MAKASKSRASKQSYLSPQQLTLTGFESPFSQQLLSTNRWVVLAHSIPWDALVSTYNRSLDNHLTGAAGINPRVAIGAMIIKHILNISDRETILQIQENMYMQYFVGYSSFSHEAPFDASVFVDIRKRLSLELVNEINEKILGLVSSGGDKTQDQSPPADHGKAGGQAPSENITSGPGEAGNHDDIAADSEPAPEGSLLIDATACPQDIAYPTDLSLLSDAREKSEELIDLLQVGLTTPKPRTYREVARKKYLQTAQKKKKTKKQIRGAIRQQLQYVRRNISSIQTMLTQHGSIPLAEKQYKYLLVIQTLYEQQKYMYDKRVHRVEDRIVSLHQPHVRPMLRGKSNADVEFGAKIQVSLVEGMAFVDALSWDAFNEGGSLQASVETYKQRFGYYPKEVMADKIYCTRQNRKWLKEKNIKLRAKPLGRPSFSGALSIPVRPGERNPIEGKFGQAKTAYGMNRIKARLQKTSESWIASIVLVLNLVNLIGKASLWLICALINAIITLKQPSKSKIQFALT
jgi:transposase, IS5 family